MTTAQNEWAEVMESECEEWIETLLATGALKNRKEGAVAGAGFAAGWLAHESYTPPARDAAERAVVEAAMTLYDADVSAQEAVTHDEHIVGQAKYEQAIRGLLNACALLAARAAATEGA